MIGLLSILVIRVSMISKSLSEHDIFSICGIMTFMIYDI